MLFLDVYGSLGTKKLVESCACPSLLPCDCPVCRAKTCGLHHQPTRPTTSYNRGLILQNTMNFFLSLDECKVRTNITSGGNQLTLQKTISCLQRGKQYLWLAGSAPLNVNGQAEAALSRAPSGVYARCLQRPPRSLQDVGSGAGVFLTEMQKGGLPANGDRTALTPFCSGTRRSTQLRRPIRRPPTPTRQRLPANEGSSAEAREHPDETLWGAHSSVRASVYLRAFWLQAELASAPSTATSL